jgi:DNA-binding NarL/FixJ family response regulator
MAEFSLDEFLEDWAKGRPALLERLAKNNGFIPASVFAAERQKFAAERIAERQQAEAERQQAEAERQQAEAERQQAEAELAAERQKTIQKLSKMGLTDTEIAEFMELDLQTIQTYIAPSV